MKLKAILLSGLVLTLGGVAATAALQEGQEMPVAKPGPEHEILAKMAGMWDAESEFMGMKSTGTFDRKLSLNGLWLISEYKGEMMGSPFAGHEVTGWDAGKGKYVSCWVDSTSMSMAFQEGTWDAESSSMTLASTGEDPTTGAEATMINVSKMTDDDHIVFSMHMGDADSPAMMTINYTRKK